MVHIFKIYYSERYDLDSLDYKFVVARTEQNALRRFKNKYTEYDFWFIEKTLI